MKNRFRTGLIAACAVPEMFLFCKSVRFFCEYQEKSVSLQTIKRKYGNNL